MSIPVLAGIISTALFAASVLPMLVKAVRTRDLSSYSLGNISTANVGNGVHAIYVFSLPPGPLWALHSFYIATSGLMLFWYFRFRSVKPQQVENQLPARSRYPSAASH